MTLRSALPCKRYRAQALLATALSGALVQFSAASARAEAPEPVDLEWTAPAECPRLAEVQATIRKLAGPHKSSASSLRAEATIARADDGDLRLRLVLHAGELVEERNIRARSCKALAGATAVAVGLLFRSGALQSEHESTAPSQAEVAGAGANGEPLSRRGPPVEGTQSSPADPKAAGATPNQGTERGSQRRWRGLAQLPLGLYGVGPLRAPSLGVGVAGGVAFEQWRFLARGAAWLPLDASASDESQQYGARIRRATVTILACRALLLSRIELAPCLTFSLQHLSARGQGAHVAARTAEATWVAVGLGARARLHVRSWLGLLVGLEGELEASRPRLFLDGLGSVETLLPAAATVSLGSEWIF